MNCGLQSEQQEQAIRYREVQSNLPSSLATLRTEENGCLRDGHHREVTVKPVFFFFFFFGEYSIFIC